MTIPIPGQYFVCHGGGFAGWLVRSGTQSPYGHSGLVMPNGKTMEARGGGVQQRDLATVIADGAVFCDEPLSDGFRDRVVLRAYQLEGRPYDMSANIDIALSLVFRMHSPYLPVGKDGAFNCAQLISSVYTDCGKILFPKLDRWRVSPRLLADRITVGAWRNA